VAIVAIPVFSQLCKKYRIETRPGARLVKAKLTENSLGAEAGK
jgi:hypothetical protein